MIPIGSYKVDWSAIRAEYVAGETSYRQLAAKYGVSKDIVARRSQAENWTKDRATARDVAAKKIIQKTAEAVADNAVIAERLKRKLLLRLERIESKYPLDATEIKTQVGKNTAIYRIRDITAAYKDLTGDLPKAANADIEDLTPLRELLK